MQNAACLGWRRSPRHRWSLPAWTGGVLPDTEMSLVPSMCGEKREEGRRGGCCATVAGCVGHDDVSATWPWCGHGGARKRRHDISATRSARRSCSGFLLLPTADLHPSSWVKPAADPCCPSFSGQRRIPVPLCSPRTRARCRRPRIGPALDRIWHAAIQTDRTLDLGFHTPRYIPSASPCFNSWET